MSESHLSISFYALLAWVIVITIALAIVALVSYRRRRSPKNYDASSLGSTGSFRGAPFTDARAKGAVNQAFDVEAPAGAIGVHRLANNLPIH